MRRYSELQEEKIRMQDLVQEWSSSGLINASQATQLKTDLAVDLKRANPLVRTAMFVFAGIVIGASFALVEKVLDLDDRGLALASLLAAIGCFLLAELLAKTFRLYRFGVEEACASASVVFLAMAADAGGFEDGLAIAVASLAALAVYLRFGYLYAALGAIACAAALPFQF